MLDLLETSADLRERVHANAARFRAGMTGPGSTCCPESTPSSRSCSATQRLPVGSPRACSIAGVYAVAFSFPVVPMGTARIRVQLSAAHTDEDVDAAVAAFVDARADL